MAYATPVRLENLQESIKEMMRGIVPSYESRRSETWAYVPYGKPMDAAHRAYTIRWEGETLSAGAALHNAHYDVNLIIRAYYNCPEDEIDLIASSDQNDIIESLNRSVDPTLPGLITVNLRTDDPILDDTGLDLQYYAIEYQIPITYMRRGNLSLD